MTPLQQLTAKIYASNPELMTLGVGCELNCYQKIEQEDAFITIVSEDNNHYWIKKHCDNSVTHWSKETILNESSTEIVTIIGKPPTLVDVLKWHSTDGRDKYSHFEVSKGEAYFCIYDGDESDSVVWDLNSIYLRDQSDGLINFLLELKK